MLNRATISPQEAVEILRENGMQIGVEVLRLGLQQGVFPFGKAVKTEKAPVYWVFPKDLIIPIFIRSKSIWISPPRSPH